MSTFRNPRRAGDQPPRRQARPAPSHGGPSAAVSTITRGTASVPAQPYNRNSPVRKCDRCHRHPGEYVFRAVSRCAEKLMPDLGLCGSCIEALQSLLVNYQNKLKQKAAAKANKPSGAPTS